MKLSEMNNEQVTEALIRISEPMSNICDDEEVVKLLESWGKNEDGLTSIQMFGRMIPQFIMLAFKKHKNDLYEIVGALSMKTVAQVAKMNFVETINIVKESYDEVLKNFFSFSGKQTKAVEEES